MKGLYKVINRLIDPLEAHEISNIIKTSNKKEGDSQVPKSHAYYNLAVCDILLGKLIDKISKAAGKTLKPTYTYCRVYLKGAELKSHKDRPSCEYSVTLNLSQTHPWPIFMNKKAVTLNPGDGVLYKGCEIEHHREIFEGDEYVQVFLHYIDVNGPYKNHVYDQLNHVKVEPEYKFLFSKLELVDNHLTWFSYPNVLSLENVKELREILDNQPLSDAQVGTIGAIDKSKRRTKVYWIPRNKDFLPLYKIFFDLLARSNNEFFQFRLNEMIELIQYSVYTSDDEGFYDWHVDMGAVNNRKLSLVCHLSDPSEYEGGELQINTGKISTVENDLGRVIIFPSFLLHRVTPVTKGIRRTLVLWVNGPPFT